MNPVDRMAARWRWRKHFRRPARRGAPREPRPRASAGMSPAVTLPLAGVVVVLMVVAGLLLGQQAGNSAAKPRVDPLLALPARGGSMRVRLEQVVDGLSTVRQRQRLELSLQNDPAAQAAPALALADGYRDAARKLERVSRRFAPLVDVLRSSERAYRTFAAAARERNAAAYKRARVAIVDSEGRLDRLLVSGTRA